MKEWINVLKAAEAAARWHVHQRRKGTAQEPYINHLLEVAMLVAEATDGKDPELIVAALLHDAIEDQEVPKSIIAERFGADVAGLVDERTTRRSTSKNENVYRSNMPPRNLKEQRFSSLQTRRAT